MKYKKGDSVRFCSDSNKEVLECCITEIKTFSTFREMLCHFGLQQCLPGVADLQQGVEIYRAFPGYSEKEEKFGVRGFRIRTLL